MVAVAELEMRIMNPRPSSPLNGYDFNLMILMRQQKNVQGAFFYPSHFVHIFTLLLILLLLLIWSWFVCRIEMVVCTGTIHKQRQHEFVSIKHRDWGPER